MHGKTCLVTGGTSGIGLATARALSARGARVVIVGRSPRRCTAAVDAIRRAFHGTQIAWHAADLSSLAAVRRLAAEIRGQYDRLDVVIHNAGAYFLRHRVSTDGFEMNLALNHLGPFLLNHLLLETVVASAPARIVVVASGAHERATLDLDDLSMEHAFPGPGAYARSKLCNLLFTRELARRLSGTGVTVNAMHPGQVATRFGRNNGWLRFWVRRALRRRGRTPEHGAETVVFLACADEVAKVTGAYFVDEQQVEPSPPARDDADAERLWQLSEELTGIRSRA